jgi:hypothetical protein
MLLAFVEAFVKAFVEAFVKAFVEAFVKAFVEAFLNEPAMPRALVTGTALGMAWRAVPKPRPRQKRIRDSRDSSQPNVARVACVEMWKKVWNTCRPLCSKALIDTGSTRKGGCRSLQRSGGHSTRARSS